MPAHPDARPARPDGGADMSRTYWLVVLVEVVVIALLYWLGRHFA
jgi:hypothetical protein